MGDNPKLWRTYQEVAQHLLNEFAAHFGLGHVEGEQKGLQSTARHS